jgi:hypothetical protein
MQELQKYIFAFLRNRFWGPKTQFGEVGGFFRVGPAKSAVFGGKTPAGEAKGCPK